MNINVVTIMKKMQSLTELYKIGRGPSSSHTMGPEKACMLFKDKGQGTRLPSPPQRKVAGPAWRAWAAVVPVSGVSQVAPI